jgi:hypothetical protein
MTAPESLCDLEMIKADYRLVSHKDRKPDYCFRIRVIPNRQEMQFDVPERRGVKIPIFKLEHCPRRRIVSNPRMGYG